MGSGQVHTSRLLQCLLVRRGSHRCHRSPLEKALCTQLTLSAVVVAVDVLVAEMEMEMEMEMAVAVAVVVVAVVVGD